MKKIILAFLLIAILSTFMMPVMADNTSPVKDYASAANGELLYTVDFSGKDGVMQFTSQTTASTDIFTYTALDDGKALHVTGAPDAKGEAGSHYYAKIPSLKGDLTTVYSMTYKISMAGDNGTNNSVGVGGLFIDGSNNGYLNFYGSYNTPGENYRRGVLQQGSAKIADRAYTNFVTLNAKYDIDSNGYMTILTVFNSIEQKFYAYLLAEGATDYTKEASWILVTSVAYAAGDDVMGFGLYTYRPTKTDATIRDVNIYKGTLFGNPFGEDTTETPTEGATEAPTTPAAPTVGAPAVGDNSNTEAPADNSMIGIIIGVVAGVAVIAAVVIVVLKKKK